MKKICAYILTVIMISGLHICANASVFDDAVKDNFIYLKYAPYLMYCEQGSAVSDVENDELQIFHSDGSTPSDDELVATGMIINSHGSLFIIIVMGDVNCDGKVTSADARLVLRCAAKLEKNLDAVQLFAISYNLNGGLPNAFHARTLLRYAAKIDDLSSEFNTLYDDVKNNDYVTTECVVVYIFNDYLQDNSWIVDFIGADCVKEITYSEIEFTDFSQFNIIFNDNGEKKYNEIIDSFENDSRIFYVQPVVFLMRKFLYFMQ